MDYKIEKATIKVEPGKNIGEMYRNMIQAAIDHQCSVYAVHNGKMYTISYQGIVNSIYKEKEEE